MSLATAVFAVIESALLRPLPLPESGRLVHVAETIPLAGLDYARLPFNYIEALRDASTLESVAAYTDIRVLLGASSEAKTYRAARVSTNYFAVLGVQPVIGRVFQKHNSQPGDRAVIVSHGLWSTLFGQRADVVGMPLLVNGTRYEVIGVVPADFNQPRDARLWFALDDATATQEAAIASTSFPWYNMVGRLKPGVTLERASAEAAVIHRRLFPDGDHRLRGTRVMTYAEHLTSDLRDQLSVWGAAAILIAILCAVNFATMSFARGMRRRGELAIRAALGASRSRLARLLLAEATIVAALSGALAVMLAWWMVSFAETLFADSTIRVSGDIGVLTVVFGIAATSAVGFLFALAPALELAKVDLRGALGLSNATSTTRRGELRGRRALVALQLSLSLMAISLIASLIRADRRYQGMSTGISEGNLVLADLAPRDTTIRELSLTPVVERVRAMPGVERAALIRGPRQVTAWAEERLDHGFRASVADVSWDYFGTLGIPLLAGRLPSAGELASRASVVVMTAASGAGPPSALVSRRFRIKRSGQPAEWVTVVGVVPAFGGWSLNMLAATMFTVEQRPLYGRGTLVARTKATPHVLVNELTESLADADTRIHVSDIRTAGSMVDRERRATRGRTVFLGGVAVLALLLAAFGVYGLTSYTTELRLREMAIRIALGASPVHLARIAIAEVWWMAAISIVAAIAASGRATVFLDALFRNPMMKGPLVTLAVGPTLVSGIVLLVVMCVGIALPLRRVLTLDVSKAVQSNS